MDLDNKAIGEYPIEFTGKHTFIADPSEKPEDVIERFPDIDSTGKTVVVTDPYLFQLQDEAYKHNVIKALKKLKASKIIYCHNNNPNRKMWQDVQTALNGCTLEYKKLDLYHDRHWFCVETKKGFYTGSSLSGIGKKYCTVDLLSEQTGNDFYKILTGQGVIEVE